MDPRMLAAILLLIVNLAVLFIGYRINYHKHLSWIAGLDVSRVRDHDGLARWVGRGLLRIGTLDLLIALIMLATSVRPTTLIAAYMAVSLVGAAVLLSRVRHYIG